MPEANQPNKWKPLPKEPRDPYKILEIPVTASTKDIQVAYEKLARKYHPDVNIVNQKEAEEWIRAINVARDILLKPPKQTGNSGFPPADDFGLLYRQFFGDSVAVYPKSKPKNKKHEKVPVSLEKQALARRQEELDAAYGRKSRTPTSGGQLVKIDTPDLGEIFRSRIPQDSLEIQPDLTGEATSTSSFGESVVVPLPEPAPVAPPIPEMINALDQITAGSTISYDGKDYEVTELPREDNGNRYIIKIPGQPVLKFSKEQLTKAFESGKVKLITPELKEVIQRVREKATEAVRLQEDAKKAFEEGNLNLAVELNEQSKDVYRDNDELLGGFSRENEKNIPPDIKALNQKYSSMSIGLEYDIEEKYGVEMGAYDTIRALVEVEKKIAALEVKIADLETRREKEIMDMEEIKSDLEAKPRVVNEKAIKTSPIKAYTEMLEFCREQKKGDYAAAETRLQTIIDKINAINAEYDKELVDLRE